MGKVKSIAKEKTIAKVERILGADIESKEFIGKDRQEIYAEMSSRFDAFSKGIEEKLYEVTVSKEQLDFLVLEILPNVEWVGQQAWDIKESRNVIVSLLPYEAKLVKRESIRAIFQFLATQKYTGTDKVDAVSDLLELFATVIQTKIASDEQLMRDAGLELQAVELGITPEQAVSDAMSSEVAK